jgi:hypothetical protein
MADAVVFDLVVRFFCIDFSDAGLGALWRHYIDHSTTLVALRQARRLHPQVRMEVQIALLSAQLVASRRSLDFTRWSGRTAMSYLRLLLANPGAITVMDNPGVVIAFRETDALVQNGLFAAQLDYQLAIHHGQRLDIWEPPESRPPTPEDVSESEAEDVPDDGIDDAEDVSESEAEYVSESEAEDVSDDGIDDA